MATNTLADFLRDRRSRLKPPVDSRRRRTPGLRREEVATRAGVSVTWYTWLEQGRGGPPSAEVLERLASALELDAAGREILFLLGQQRPPPLTAPEPPQVTSALQGVLDAMPLSPAFVKTPTWDIVAWNAAAEAVFGGYATTPRRNTLRRMFGDAEMRARLPEWEAIARFTLSVFRIDVARAGGWPGAEELVAELSASSADFRRMWAEHDVQTHGAGVKQVRHQQMGVLNMEYSAFDVDGATGLSMVVYTPATAADAQVIARFMARAEKAA